MFVIFKHSHIDLNERHKCISYTWFRRDGSNSIDGVGDAVFGVVVVVVFA